ncbi:hypothetical protein [Mesorhizobium sp. B3-1-7]|uniref:hypothetical protein n=1 Tax=Mesorhizobium sp. B3-1-7 TaxID=2589894 RepID=UPI0015E279F8|nr:hypothetical protein [Mesorhizobium sp. B3-1-7]
MNAPDQKQTDEAKFNETLKRMLKTPPAPHDSDKSKQSQAEKRKAKVVKASPSFSSKR